ncbi:MAG: hypothetical protein ACR2G2_03635 [Pseudonocardia sp.]
MTATDAATKTLGTYLNDHLAGAHTGVEMARKLHDDVAGEPDAATLGTLAKDIEEDLDTLRELVDMIGVASQPVKQAAGWLAEKAQRLGVGQARTGDPHLTRLLQAETLALGVEGKLGLWLALMEVRAGFPPLVAVDLPALVERARDQRRRLEEIRLAAVRRAFTDADQPGGAASV